MGHDRKVGRLDIELIFPKVCILGCFNELGSRNFVHALAPSLSLFVVEASRFDSVAVRSDEISSTLVDLLEVLSRWGFQFPLLDLPEIQGVACE